MNILVTGANGQLGNEMRIVAGQTDYNWVFTDVSGVATPVPEPAEGPTSKTPVAELVEAPAAHTEYLDITDAAAVRAMVAKYGIDAIVNCAAFTNVEAAESNYELAEKLNAGAPAILAAAMKEVGGVLVHISTDYVFGKEPYNTPCKEDQTGTPTGVYGLTKLHGEQNILASGCDYVIIRTAWLYSEFGKNFCKTMMALTASKPQLKVVFDQAGTPTYALDLANAIVRILGSYKGNTGIYHFSNEGVCSWFDFTKMIQEYCGNSGCDVQPCHSDEFPSAVTRPAYSVLDKTKIKTVFGVDVPYWTDSLRKCIENLKEWK